MLERLRKQLLKLDSIKRLVADYRRRMKKERHAKRWATLMHSGRSIHDIKPVRPFGMGKAKW